MKLLFKFKPFFLLIAGTIFLAMLLFIPVGWYIFHCDNAPASYYFVFLFVLLFPLLFVLNFFNDATYLKIDRNERSLRIRTGFNTKIHDIPMDDILGFSKSFMSIGVRGSWHFDSIILYTKERNFEFASFNIFSFKKLNEALLEQEIHYFGEESYNTDLIGRRKFEYGK